VRLLARPLGVVISVLGGVVASYLFSRVWTLVTNEEHAPEATDRRRGWGEVLSAAALEGAIFGVVKASLDRSGAIGIHRATGEWPGKK
jgi:predicted metal-dependent enzyme (double-stranded beta helix superfamily)